MMAVISSEAGMHSMNHMPEKVNYTESRFDGI